MNTLNENEVIDVLKQCYDPEIPLDLWNLGLIYNIKISKNSSKNYNIDIIMTLTTPGCTMGNIMANDIKSKLEMNKLIDEANIDITFDPPWSPEMMSDHAREKLGFPKPSENSNVKNNHESEWE